MGSMSTGAGSSNDISTFTGGLILAGAVVTIVATSKMVQCVVNRLRNQPAVDPGAEIIGTGEHPLNHQVQMNEIILSPSSGNTDGATINVVATVATPADNEEQVQVVIEAPPSRSGHSTDAQNAMADVLTATYRLLADYVFSTFASGTFW
ncbi:hypothetical protein CY35_01G034400 [Sphagnum magellanicum]|nr:hypothetical protein CY35_01G034400 [Sphagnum magellanicum]KAH9574048.1 hypothetical protein CY35_01G034400 [Sphagnum magellanicum]KAH9574049.1 hypothetical protein CY35_01G034400 [Sphagnum magellanicum]